MNSINAQLDSVSAPRPQLFERVGLFLLVLTTAEASLMGSGRLIQLGPLTLKMWLFILVVAYSALSSSITPRVSRASVLLSAAWLVLLLLASIIGLGSGAPMDAVGEDVKPLLFFFAIFYFESVVTHERQIRLVVRIIKISAFIICVGYIALGVLFIRGVIGFKDLFRWFADAGGSDIMFRGTSGMIFYKGSIYIAIALIFLAFERGKKAIFGIIVSCLGLIATGTRGFLVALVGVAVVYILISSQSIKRKAIYGVTFVLLSLGAYLLIAGTLEDKSESDYVRIAVMNEVIDTSNPLSFVFGHGFGVGVPERPIHMEISYLEVFHKQGLLGLLWWAAIVYLLAMRFKDARQSSRSELAYPLLLSSLFVLIESTTNPWINNPIGMFVLLFSLAGLRALTLSEQTSQYAPEQLRLGT
jgi:O-antigen ligase